MKSPDIWDCFPVHVEPKVVFVQISSGLTSPEASIEGVLSLAVRTNLRLSLGTCTKYDRDSNLPFGAGLLDNCQTEDSTRRLVDEFDVGIIAGPSLCSTGTGRLRRRVPLTVSLYASVTVDIMERSRVLRVVEVVRVYGEVGDLEFARQGASCWDLHVFRKIILERL